MEKKGIEMKSYTDINQSKKLAEILPLESADMGYIPSEEDDDGNTLYTAEFKSEFIFDDDCCIQCWSLAALMELIPCADIVKLDTTWTCGSILGRCEADNPVDACVDMIIKLHEQKLL